MYSKNNTCRLCKVITNPFQMGNIRKCDIPFKISPTFLTIPALGPLCLGHVMIVSRNHYSSLLSMDFSVRDELESQCHELSRAWPTHNLTFAEHGASCADASGPCISHTHINVFPDIPPNLLSLEKQGHKLLEQGYLSDLPLVRDSYFLIGHEGKWSLYDTADAPSQHIRQILYNYCKVPHWDWRLLTNHELVDLTLSAWSEHLPEERAKWI